MKQETTDTGETRDPQAIRRDIQQTRGEMDGTVDQLVDRLSVGSVVDDLWRKVRGEGGDVGHVVREHPIPLALMGLGLGWLAIEHSTGRSLSGASASHGGGRHSGHEADRESDSGSFQRSHGDTGRKTGREGMADGDDDDSGGFSERASEMTDRVKDRSSELGSSFKEMGQKARRQTREQTQAARRGLKNMMEENPLILGGIVFGLGLASGLSAPSTRFEDEQMGEASDRLKDQAREAGREGVEQVRESGREVAGAAIDEARHQVEEVEDEYLEDRGDDRGHDRDRPGGGEGERKTMQ